MLRLVAILLVLPGLGYADAMPILDRPALAARAALRFPQPVRVGDLIDRQLLAPRESQPVLGRVAGVVRHADGTVDLVVRAGGLLGIGTHRVTIPIEAIGLLGEHVALLDISADQLGGLSAPEGAALGPDETIRVGLTKPFH